MGKLGVDLVTILVAVFVALHLPFCLSLPSTTAPAFLWSPHQDGMKGVSYQTLSPKDLAKSVMSLGGWSNLLCSGKEPHPSVDVALLFVGREIQSSDISGRNHADAALLELIKGSFTKSNHFLSFPYVAASEEKEAIESSLVSEFAETCGHDLGASNVAFTESCSVDGAKFEKLEDIQSIHDYLVPKMEKRAKGKANVIVFCNGGSSSLKELDRSLQSWVFSDVITSVEQSGAKYSVLYVSEPFRLQYSSNRELQRSLAEGTFGNGSANSSACDGVCQIKSSLLEGIFVGIVLLIILISGLCCMMGIDTPTRFEAPQDS